MVYGQKEFNWSEYSKTLCTIGKCKLIDSFDHFYKYKNENINWKNQLYFISDQHFNKLGAELLSNVVLKNINIEWRKIYCLQKYVNFAIVPLNGEKNGDWIGRELNIVQRSVLS